jgi:hypothetical protein
MAEPVALSIKPPAMMSLGDMVNMARGAQAYQQAEQVNPLVLQRAQQEARTGQIDLSVKEQGDLERKNLQSFMSNPQNWQNETGDVDVNKINAEVTKIAPLTGRDHIEKLTTLAKSQTENLKATQDLTQGERAIIAGPLGVLGRMNVKDKNVYLQELDNQAKFHPDNKRLQRLIDAQKDLIKQMPKDADMASAGIRAMENLLNPTEAIAAFSPKGGSVDAGGNIISTVATPSVGGLTPSIAKTGVISDKTLAPQLATSETGLPKQYGGGNSSGIINPAPNPVLQPPAMQFRQPAGAPVGAPTRAPAVAPVSGAATGMNQQFGAKGGLEMSQGEHVDTYKARVARLAALPAQANKELSLANNDSIPNQEFTNNKVLKLLESKNIRVGKLAEAISKKTGGIGLNSEEVEIQKYLEQRIRQNALRSNQDEDSQKMASGSFGTDINALRDIIYNDKGLLASQRLLNQGILKYQGNPNKPNLAAINDFENKFNMLNQDRNVTHLLGIVGDRAMEDLSKSDVQQLKKTFGGMSKDQMDKLFEKKQELENLVRGAR